MDLIQECAINYKENVLPYIFIYKFKDKIIAIFPREDSFKHLVATQHTELGAYKILPPTQFFDQSLRGIIQDDLLFYKSSESKVEKNTYVSNRVIGLLELQDVLTLSTEIARYHPDREPSNSLKCDYLILRTNSEVGLYLAIRKDDKSRYHVMNSFVADPYEPGRYRRTQTIETLTFIARVIKKEAPSYFRKNGFNDFI